ncbi:MAG: hypothetical protein PHQ36_04110 [Anaerolineales bacterium]|nr:hypothetical protein [Anaerolineales bacterium]
MMTTFAVLGMLYIWRDFLVLIGALLLGWFCLAIVSRKFDMRHPNFTALAISLATAVYFGVNYVQIFQESLHWDENASMAVPITIDAPSIDDAAKPDIYYIILDGYGGAEMLEKLHGFDNSPFIAELQKRGFIVPPKSKANYPRTILSLSSSLNMQYLDGVSRKMGNSYLWWPLKGTFANNEARKFLESRGYKTVAVSSSWDFTSIANADVYMEPHPVFPNTFEEAFVQNTNVNIFGSLGELGGMSFPSYKTHRMIVKSEFASLEEIPALESPKFVFVHVVSPHAPFVFDAQGNEITPDYPFTFTEDRYFLSPPSKYRNGYIGQIQFVNKQILDSVDVILETSKTPPIIIIQGDHGSGVFTDYSSLQNTCVYERYSILNAYYFPGMDANLIPDDVAPVNTFRILFNNYFSAGLELLPNRHYFSPATTMYQFKDVTDQADVMCTNIPTGYAP